MMRETAESVNSGALVEVVPVSTRKKPHTLPRRQVATAALGPLPPYRHLLRLRSHSCVDPELAE